ncbi:ABC transporter permease [Umezawaea sp. Da 62-37]|uniref:ABC transporter permease n=1 Tax=Umezawaea sp. Da 62-37 TaxID=3075927 RepID=UPI0028F6EF71|nr:ABC transporter permease [Umezawaea sp. Da 62-37]WNV84755.1 ABC transporter permease [Umezawaea sp. Da 62-37]
MITKVLTIAGTNLHRLFRDRTNLFFVLVLPLMLILVLGAAFGGSSTPKLGVVGADSGRLLDALHAEPGVRVETVSDEAALRTAVERGELAAGLVVPPSLSSGVATGGVAELRLVVRQDSAGQQTRLLVAGVLAQESGRLAAGAFAADLNGTDPDTALSTVDSATKVVPGVSVSTTTTGEALFPPDLGQFSAGASSQLLLFMFLTAMNSSVALVETRRLGISRRMVATPTSTATIVLGEGLGRVVVSLVQGVIIIAGTSLLFGVRWGNPLAATALLLLFSLVAGGAGMLLGSVFRTEQQAGGVGTLVALGSAALGGCMVPLELFGGTMRDIALLTPHAWANQGFAELARDGGTLPDVLPELGVLTGFAAVLFTLGAWRLRTLLTN